MSLVWNAPRQDWGTVRISLQGTYVLNWESQLDTVNYVSQLGTDAYGSAIPRWRSLFTLNWSYGPWGATLAQTYTSGYADESLDVSGVTRKVEPFAPWDLQGSYTGFSGWQLVGRRAQSVRCRSTDLEPEQQLPGRLRPAGREPARPAVLPARPLLVQVTRIAIGRDTACVGPPFLRASTSLDAPRIAGILRRLQLPRDFRAQQ